MAVSADVVSCTDHRFECRDLRQHRVVLHAAGKATRVSLVAGMARGVSSCCIAIPTMEAPALVQFPPSPTRVGAFHLADLGESHVQKRCCL